MSIINELEWRGAINQQTDAQGLAKLTDEKEIHLYCGVDPTGDSMHIGHLIPFMVLKRFQLAGHHPVVIIGGATGSIGDPSGRDSERTLQTMETVNANARALTKQMEKLFMKEGAESGFKILNNYDWLSRLDLLTFLRDYGKHFNVNLMLAKDIVASRLDSGISFTEFSYQILQSIDFHHLWKEHDVQLQVGGADQWGNITGGLDFIRRMEGSEAEAYGLTIPLMTRADGSKFGKSAGGETVWLDPEKTTPYEFYQFWLNQRDEDVPKFLKYFTFLSKEAIEELEEEIKTQAHLRVAHRRLAEEITSFVHGPEAVKDAQLISEALFTGQVQDLSMSQVEQAANSMPQHTAEAKEENLAIWLVDTGIIDSRRQAREFIQNGAILINGERITDLDATISPDQAIGGKYIIVRRGRRNYFLVTYQ